MRVITVKNDIEGGKIAFTLLEEKMKAGAQTLGLATGSSPITFYEEIVKSNLDFSNMVSINLDEYVGIAASNDQSYSYFMHKHLFDAKPFKENNLPNGLAKDLKEEIKRYDAVINANPIDFQILGIGRNGHIGFNEPGTPFDITTHVVDLAPSTIEKAEAIASMIKGPITEDMPASILQKHDDVVIIVDEAAASKL